MSNHTFEELAALHAVAKALAQPWDLRDQLEQVLGEMSARLGMQRGMISILDRDTGEALLEVAHGIDLEGVDISYHAGEGITGTVAQTGQPIAVPSLGREALFLDRTGARRHLKNRDELAFLCVPITYDSRVVGILSADKPAGDVADMDRELAMLAAVAELIAKAVHVLALNHGRHRAALRMPQHQHQAHAQVFHGILNTGQHHVIHHVAGVADDEQVADAHVKDQLDRHARIRTT